MIIGNNIQSEDQHIFKDQAKNNNVKKSHLEDKPPSRPLPSPAARSEPQGLVARPSRGPWPWPSRTWPSLWPPPSTNPQSLGIPIKSQPHPSPPHHSEKKTRSYNDNRWMILPMLWTIDKKLNEGLLQKWRKYCHCHRSRPHWMQRQRPICAKIVHFHFSKANTPSSATLCRSLTPKTRSSFSKVSSITCL